MSDTVALLHVLRRRQFVGRYQARVVQGIVELAQPLAGAASNPCLQRHLRPHPPSSTTTTVEFDYTPAPSPPTPPLQILADVAQALRHMHELDPPLIHRDVKSPNILLTASLPDARARLADLGCTKVSRLSLSCWAAVLVR